MAKQVIKGMTMFALVGILVFVTSAAANAQLRSHIHANIPFEFQVGNKSLAAGEYDINSLMTQGDTLVVSNGENSAVRLTNNLISTQTQKNSKLVFHRYGDRYFLAEVWRAGESTGRGLVSSKAEDAMRHELTAVYRIRGIKQDVYERVELLAAVTH